jgi:hypothetical protein
MLNQSSRKSELGPGVKREYICFAKKKEKLTFAN